MTKRRTQLWIGALVVVLGSAALALGAARVGVAQGSAQSGGTLQVWLGGDLTEATPGSPTKAWLDLQVKRFLAKYPGWKFKFTFLPFDNAQKAAKLEAAFAAHNSPDIINFYGGQFTTTYAKLLQPLNSLVKASPGMYASMPESQWDAECVPNFQCNGGRNEIVGVPFNASTYTLFYNKRIFKKAGISRPPATYTELFADCEKLNAQGIIPVSMGASDGYDTSNIWTTNLVSTLQPGDVQGVLSGKIPYDNPRFVAALEPVLKITSPSTHCTSPNALGEDQLHGTNEFTSGKAAMAFFFPLEVAAFRKALGQNNVGEAKQPLSGHGPLLHVKSGYAAIPSDAWSIAKGSKNAAIAWQFIKIASDAQAQATEQTMIGFAPAISSVTQHLKDPTLKYVAELADNPAIPELDQVMPSSVANFLYRELGLGQEQKQSALQTLQAVNSYAKVNKH